MVLGVPTSTLGYSFKGFLAGVFIFTAFQISVSKQCRPLPDAVF